MLLSKEVSYEKMFSLVLALSLLLSLSTTGYVAVNDDCNNITIDVFEEHFYYDGDCRTENCIRLQKSFLRSSKEKEHIDEPPPQKLAPKI